MAIKIGITGGIGSGKSVVSHLLEVMGVPVYISDEESKKVVATDPVIRKELCDLVGEEVFSGGKLNKTLWPHIFSLLRRMLLRLMESYIRGLRRHFRQWSSHKECLDIIGMESAILIESGFADEVDCIVMVYAPLELRVERAVRRDNASCEQIDAAYPEPNE